LIQLGWKQKEQEKNSRVKMKRIARKKAESRREPSVL